MKLKDIIDQHGHKPFTINENKRVEDAITTMAEKSTSALLVEDDTGRTQGIFTERDIVYCYGRLKTKDFLEAPISQHMTHRLIVARPHDSLEQSISLMIQADIRHLPVVDNGKVVAIFHLCDLVHEQVGVLNADIHYLEEYLQDLDRAKQD